MTRRSDCAQRRKTTYAIQFPFGLNPDKANYEIDKLRALFIAGGEDPSEYFAEIDDEQLSSLLTDFSNWPRWTDVKALASEEETGIPIECAPRRIEWALRAIVVEDVNYLRRHLDTSKDACTFIHGVDAQYFLQSYNDDEEHANETSPPGEDDDNITGNTALHFATCERSSEVIKLLLEQRAEPNVVNKEGWNPLAEAALWGRRENFELLLEHGADKEMQCFQCNGRLRKAIEFAKDLDENKEERYRRAGREHRICKEDTFQRDRGRKAIVRLLQDEGAEEPHQSNHNLASFKFT